MILRFCYLPLGGQINPNGSESINLNLVEKLTIGSDKQWVRMPDLNIKRHDSLVS